nr:PREDICTED: uncharacterized protein LOC106704494 [Latimeria chalumnae]|eukprot:XP_014347132.1 PREDICTED: uncharacterized protein LOC106704494 [Latimeria chalumnae]
MSLLRLVLLLPLLDRSSGTVITQSPSVCVKKGQSVQLQCEQDGSDSYMYWYRQDRQEGLRLLFYSVAQGNVEKSDDPPSRFSAQRPSTKSFPLNVTKVESEDTAVYLCASSLDTAVQPDGDAEQKPHCGDGGRGRKMWCGISVVADATTIEQNSTTLWVKGSTASLYCRQSSDDMNMFWYRQYRNAGLDLIFHSVTGSNIQQFNNISSPPSVYNSTGNSLHLHCEQDSSSYYYMFWYQQSRGEALKLIGYSHSTGTIQNEEGFKKRFEILRASVYEGSLNISDLTAGDSAVYFCAASEAQWSWGD